MARHTITTLVDDLDGSTAETTVNFGLDGQLYEIDLNSRHEHELRKTLRPFLDAARRVRAETGRRRSDRGGTDKDRNAAIRAWAAAEGVELNTRGRIANAVQEAFDAQDGDALRAAFGIELEQPKPRRGRRGA